MYKLDLPNYINDKEADAIRRRRAAEEARKERIFNPKIRQIGIDVTALEQQARERCLLKEKEREREIMMDNDRVKADLLASYYEKKQFEEKKKMAQELNEFRASEQRYDKQREWDLNDPNFLKNQDPIRFGNDDSRLGVSSLQIFNGEDLGAKERKERQREEMRGWIVKQLEAKGDDKMIERQTNEYYGKLRRMEDERYRELERNWNAAKKAVNLAQNEYNKNLSNVRAKLLMENARKDEEDKLREILNHVNGDLLSENPNQAKISYNLNDDGGGYGKKVAILADRWKGLSAQEKDEEKRKLLHQIEEKRIFQCQNKQLDKEWDNYVLGNIHKGVLRERELERLEKDEKRRLAMDNYEMAKNQACKNAYLDNVVYVNSVGDEFFNQWNTSTR